MVDVISKHVADADFAGCGARITASTPPSTANDRRQRSVLYLEACASCMRCSGGADHLPARLAISLWQSGSITTGATWCSPVRSAFRCCTRRADLAVALVDVTQHVARLTEGAADIVVPHDCATIAGSAADRARASVTFDRVSFTYRDGRQIFDDLSLSLDPGQRVGTRRHSGGGKSTLFALLQRFYDVQAGAS